MNGMEMQMLIDPPQDGPTNMAIDECLLNLAIGGGGGTLRLYRWAPATLSLGYFQAYEQFLELSAREGMLRDLSPLPVVRRCTGGGAILHAEELTYSLVLPAGHPLAKISAESLYTWMHERISAAVAMLGGQARPKGDGAASARGGPFLCYECLARFDLLVEGAKLVGSAQRRTRAGVLQHGGVVLQKVHPQQPGASLYELLGRSVEFEELAKALAKAMRSAGVAFAAAQPSSIPSEILAAKRAVYAGESWTRRR